MTKEQAIEVLNTYYRGEDNDDREFCSAIDMAIKALEQQPSDDCVSRTQALKELKESAEHHANDSREEVLLRRDRDIIRALPPVTPTRKVGKILVNDKYRLPMYECLGCKKLVMEFWKYCPHCGANIEGCENEN